MTATVQTGEEKNFYLQMRFLLFFWHLAVSVCVSFKSCHCPDDGEPAAGVVSFPRTIEVGESPALPQDRARHLHKIGSW